MDAAQKPSLEDQCLLHSVLDIQLAGEYLWPVYNEDFQHRKNSTKKQDYGLCSSQVSSTSEGSSRILRSLSDFILIGFMVGASVYMVLLLYRHWQRMRHFHTFSISYVLSSETKATQRILFLTSIFILLSFNKSILMLHNSDTFKFCYWFSMLLHFCQHIILLSAQWSWCFRIGSTNFLFIILKKRSSVITAVPTHSGHLMILQEILPL